MDAGFSKAHGILISLVLSVSYVILIYVKKPNIKLDRNDPIIVSDRIKKISWFSLITIIVLPIVLSNLSKVPIWKIYDQYGLLPGLTLNTNSISFNNLITSVHDIFKNLLLVILLFNGPLIDYFFFNDSYFTLFDDLYYQLSTIQGQRDLIIGPLTEEIIYTASMIVTLYQVPDIPTNYLIYLPPCFFSIAHFHHAYELIKKGTIPLKFIILSCLFQLFYTFLFGIFTNFLFLRTKNFWSCFTVHFFCNFMGFPKLTGFDNNIWRVIYYFLLILGIYLFKKYLLILTESPFSLINP